MFRKLSKSALALVLALSVACPMVTNAEETNVPAISVEQPQAEQGTQVQTEQNEVASKPVINVSAADHNPKKYKNGVTAKEPIELTIQHDKAFTYSIQWDEGGKYSAPTNAEEKVDSQTSEEPVTLVLEGNESGDPVKYHITAVEEGQEESNQASFDIVVDLPKKSVGGKIKPLALSSTIISSEPANGSSGVDYNTAITIKLPLGTTLASGTTLANENLVLLGIKLERIFTNDNSIVLVPSTLTVSTINNEIKIAIVPDESLKGSASYRISVPAEKLKLNNDTNAAFVANFTTKVDDVKPTVALFPPDTATNVPVTVEPTFTFSEPILIKDSSGTNIVTAQNAGEIVELRDANSNTKVNTTVSYDSVARKITLHPVKELTPNKMYKLVVSDSKIIDWSYNKFDGKETVFQVVNDTTPITASFNPTNGASNVDPGVSPTITFSEAAYLSDGTTTLSSLDETTLSTLFTLTNSNNQPVTTKVTYDSSTRVLTIDPTTDLAFNTNYVLKLLGNKVRDQVNPAIAETAISFTTKGDSSPPTFTSAPAENATAVALDTNIVLTFNEPVTFQSTSYPSFITIRNTTTNNAVPFSVNWDQNSKTLTIDPSTDLEVNRTYSVAVAANFVRDVGNNYNAARTFTFSTTNVDNRPPTAVLYPATGATGISLNTSLTITFSEPVIMSNGAAVPGPSPYSSFYLMDNNNNLVPGSYSYNATNYRLTIQPTQLLRSNTTYRLVLVGSAVRDNANQFNAQTVSSFTTINDTAAPTASIYPWNGYPSYPVEGNLKITFSEPVYLSNGTEINYVNASNIFVLRDNSTGSNVTAYTLSYNPSLYELTIDPTVNLKGNASYSLFVIQNTLRDSSGNYVSQIASTFTTATDMNPPSINFSPSNGSTGNAVTTNITLSFSEPVILQSADYASYITLRENGKTVNTPFTGSWNSSSQQLVLDPTSDLLPNRTYYLTVAAGLVKDQTNNPNSSVAIYFGTQNDYSAPTFTTNPNSGTTGVSLTSDVSVTVSEPFTHYDGTEVTTQNVAGVVSLVDSRNKTVESMVTYSSANRTITINPVPILRSNEEYRIVIASNKIKDLAGNANSSFTSTFRTVNYGVPYISSDVMNGQTNVAVSRSFHISFSENVVQSNGTSINNSNVGKLLTFKDGSGKNIPFSATWDADNLMIKVEPKGKLLPSTYYYIRIEAGTVQNVSGVKNSLFTLSFSTVNNSDLPSVTSAPENGEEDVPLDTEIYVQFSKPVVLANGSKLTNQNSDSLVQLKSSAGESVKYKAEWDEENLILTLNPSTRLKKNEAYTIYLPEGVVKDEASNPVRSYTASFYTIRDKGLINIISNPQNGEEDVPTDEPLYIGFGESVTLKNSVKITNSNIGSVIDMYDENMKKLSVKYEWDDKKYTVKITPVTTLKSNSTYSIVVKAGKVYNRLKKTNAGYIVTFNTSTEDTPPEVTTNPDDGDDNFSIKGNIEVVFKEPVTLTNGTELTNDNVAKLVKIIDENGKAVACKFKWVASSKKIILDPKLNLKKDHTYSIYMEAGVVSDLSGNLNEEFVSQFTTAKK
ncbi:Ig-like domain-containing protein [Brevibacillus sp. SYSU BS000544]|uniref:Ig-like domain-containing protein n=1 Tax=Brevibacillus sp. SYSU BS000544 TaxID=3416443 RepID=UPI003CE55EF9